VRPALGELHWYSVLGSVAAAMAGSGCTMLAWRALLADLGSPLPVPVASRVTFVAQLGKYVPGAIWSFGAHVELGHDYQVPRRRGAASVMVALAVSIATGLLIAAIALPLASPAVLRKYALVLAVAPVIAVCLAPPILHRILNIGLRIIRQEPLEQPVRWRGLGVAIGWNVLGWLLYGTQVWLLLTDVAKDGTHSMLLAIGAYALAFSLALLLVVFPNGIGAREVLLAAALAPLLMHGPALAVALVVRVVTTISDLAWGGIGVALGRTARVAGLATGQPGLAAIRRQPGRHRKATSRPWQRPQPAIEAADNAAAPAA
jgi:glycosyltransferase 2 family protein